MGPPAAKTNMSCLQPGWDREKLEWRKRSDGPLGPRISFRVVPFHADMTSTCRILPAGQDMPGRPGQRWPPLGAEGAGPAAEYCRYPGLTAKGATAGLRNHAFP